MPDAGLPHAQLKTTVLCAWKRPAVRQHRAPYEGASQAQHECYTTCGRCPALTSVVAPLAASCESSGAMAIRGKSKPYQAEEGRRISTLVGLQPRLTIGSNSTSESKVDIRAMPMSRCPFYYDFGNRLLAHLRQLFFRAKLITRNSAPYSAC